jgi:hypothetical protein
MNISTAGFKTWRMREEEARQQAAFFLACGVDLSLALRSAGADREAHVRRIERLIERERLKGAWRHWSYDLNRHIALKQALDRLRSPAEEREPFAEKKTAPEGAAIS